MVLKYSSCRSKFSMEVWSALFMSRVYLIQGRAESGVRYSGRTRLLPTIRMPTRTGASSAPQHLMIHQFDTSTVSQPYLSRSSIMHRIRRSSQAVSVGVPIGVLGVRMQSSLDMHMIVNASFES